MHSHEHECCSFNPPLRYVYKVNVLFINDLLVAMFGAALF